MTSTPRFLISVPTYNRRHLLPRVMESIQSQGFKNFDILFVDDCGSDDTPEYIQGLQAEASNIYYHRMTENSGVNAVRNKILEIAKRDFPESYIYFIDDDDQLYKDALQEAANAIQQNPDYNWYALTCVYPDNKPISRLKRFGEMNYIEDFMFGSAMRGDLTNIVKVSGIGDSHFSKAFKNAEIWYFWTSLSLKHTLFAVDKIGSIKEYLPDGITQNGFNRDKAIEVALYKINTLEPIVGTKKLRHQYVTLAKHLIKQGRKKEAQKYLKKVFSASPLYFRQYRHWIKSVM